MLANQIFRKQYAIIPFYTLVDGEPKCVSKVLIEFLILSSINGNFRLKKVKEINRVSKKGFENFVFIGNDDTYYLKEYPILKSKFEFVDSFYNRDDIFLKNIKNVKDAIEIFNKVEL